MAKIFKVMLPLIVIVGGFIGLKGLNSLKKEPEKKEVAEQALLVDIMPVEMTAVNFSVASQGSVMPRTETSLVSEVSGKIVSVSDKFVAGGIFLTNELVLQIDPSDYQVALKRAEANLASRKAQLLSEQARADQALKDWRQLRGNQGSPSDLVLRKPQVAEAKANVRAAEADLEKAKRDLQRTKIRMPYAGMVRSKQVDIGQYVSPGTRLGNVFAVDSAEVRLPIKDSDLAYLDLPGATEVDKTTPVTLSARQNGALQTWTANIVRTEGVVDEKTRQIFAVAEITDPYGLLGESQQSPIKIGTFVSVNIQGIEQNDLIVLPRHVLRTDNTLLVANDADELEVRSVSVERSDPEFAYISGGINDAERIVTTAIEVAIPGTKLTFGEATDDASGSATDPETSIAIAGGNNEP